MVIKTAEKRDPVVPTVTSETVSQPKPKRGHIRERIVRILLNNPHGNLTKYRMAKLARGSYPWVHDFLGQLEDMGLVEKTRVLDYGRIVSLWRKFMAAPDRRDYTLKDPLGFLRLTSLPYALSTYAAENLVQKHLFPSRIDFYIDPADRDAWHGMLSREGLVGGGNTRMLIGDAHVLYNTAEREGYRIVSVPQLIVDLLMEGARAQNLQRCCWKGRGIALHK